MKKLPTKFITVRKEEKSPPSVKTIAGKEKSPSISRKIPEVRLGSWVKLATLQAHWEIIFVSFVCGILLMGIAVMGFRLNDHYRDLIAKQAQREELTRKRMYWQGIVEKYPDYKDAYYQLAVFSYELGDIGASQDAVKSALRIDPNDTNGEELLRKIRG